MRRTPDRIFEIAQGFMASKHLFAASELGLFEALGEGPVDLDGLAARTGLTRRTARISADAMVAIGLLERQGDRYANTPGGGHVPVRATPADLRPLLRFWDRLSYPAWTDLAGALGRGRPAHRDLRDRRRAGAVMSAGIAAATAAACRALPAAAGLPAASRVLDIGGGTGSWSIALAAGRPGTHRDRARTGRGRRGRPRNELRDRGVRRPRSTSARRRPRRRRCPAGYDAFLLANLVHYFTPRDEPVDPAADPRGSRTRRHAC